MDKWELKKLHIAMSIISGRFGFPDLEPENLPEDYLTSLGFDRYAMIERGYPSREEILGVCEQVVVDLFIRVLGVLE